VGGGERVGRKRREGEGCRKKYRRGTKKAREKCRSRCGEMRGKSAKIVWK